MGLLPVLQKHQMADDAGARGGFRGGFGSGAVVAAVDAVEAVAGAVVLGVASLRIRSGFQSPSWAALSRT